MAPKQMAIPQPFSYLLPGQGLVAGVAIYSTIYVFGVGKIPFILAVVAAGLHFLLGVYFCFVKNRLRTHDLYLVPAVLVAGAGVWAGSLYYFAKRLDLVVRLGRVGGQPETPTWTKVGTSMTGLNVLLDIILLIVFIVAASKKPSPYPQQQPIYNPPTAPAHAPTFPVAPATVQYQQPQQQYQQQQYYQVATVPIIQQQQQQPAAPQRIVSSTSSDFKTPLASTISPATSPSPSQQYQQYQQQPQIIQYQQQRQQSFTSQQQQPPQQTTAYTPQYQQQQAYVFPPSSPQPQPPTPSQQTITQPRFQTQSQQSQTSGSNPATNRIDTLRRLSSLQSPAGNWVYTAELASLLQLWGDGDGDQISPNTPARDITLQTQRLMASLRDYIYSAQREGRVQSALSTAELASLQGVNWDLGWVGLGIERAEGWLSGHGNFQTQQQQQYGGAYSREVGETRW